MKLIVITQNFPYCNTETFLESEYPFLQKSFEEVVYFPLIKGECRKGCLDAKICNDYADLYRQKVKYLIRVLFSIGLYSSLWKQRTQLFEKNFLANIFKQEFHFQVFRTIIKQNLSLHDENTIFYSYWFNAPVYALLKLREKLNLKYKVVCRAHRFDVYDENGEMPNREYCIRTINKVFPISQDAINWFTNKYGHSEKYVLSRLGVKDLGRIASHSSSNSFHILSVSIIHPRKRIYEIFQSVKEFTARHPELSIMWTHFGDGVQLKDFLLWTTTGHNLPNLTIKIKGRVANSDILKYIGETPLDVFINLSTSEGVPVSIMEAQSFGLPVIATDVGGTREIMNTNNGILLPSSPKIEQVVDALDKIMYNHFDRNEIKKSWKAYSDASLNFKIFVNHLCNL